MARHFDPKVTVFILSLVFIAGNGQNSPTIEWVRPQTADAEINVLESAKKGEQVYCCFKAIVKNPPASTTDHLEYHIDSPNFEIEKHNGTLFVLRPVNHEDLKSAQLTVEAIYGSSLKSQRRMTVNILDVNDEKPVFKLKAKGATVPADPNKGFATFLPESTKVGTVFYDDNMVIQDNDESFTFHRLGLTCSKNGTGSPESRANAIKACEWFSVTATEFREPNATRSSYKASFKLLKPLNFRANPAYVMVIRAQDTGTPPLHSDALFTISINDTQNEPPEFNPTAPYSVTVSEAAPLNSRVITVSAQDRDMTNVADKNEVRITLKPDHNNTFDIDSGPCSATPPTQFYCGKLKLIKKLDREIKSRYALTAIATEYEKNVKTNFTKEQSVEVIVLDVNDEAPIITPDKLQMTITEKRQGTIFTVRVRDGDTAANAKFRVTLQQKYPAFVLQTNAKENDTLKVVSVAVKNSTFLDFEKLEYRKHIINVIATEFDAADKVNPLHTSTGTYTIIVTNVNDNSPAFHQKSYTAQVVENSPVGTTVITITANDKDPGDVLTYKMEGDSAGRFKINETTGLITVNSPGIDYETTPVITLFIFATDKDKKEVTVKLEIKVIDVNDVDPVWDKPLYTTKVVERARTLTPPVTLKATDKETNRIIYKIVAGNTADNAFQVNPNTGVLSLMRGLGYKESKNGVFTLIVEASDGGNPAGKKNATVKITINDINDFPPEFSQKIYRAQVNETARGDTKVVQVSATDKDGGANGEFKYRIESGAEDKVIIDAQTGEIKTSPGHPFDYNKKKEYTVVVMAQDNGTPQKTGSATAIITVIDRNNVSPSFDKFDYRVNILASSKKGEVILTVKATDPDSSAKLRYDIDYGPSFLVKNVNNQPISAGTIKYKIGINHANGQIHLVADLNPESATFFTFRVKVTDENAENPPQQIAQATVHVTIYRKKGDAPYFSFPWSPENPRYSFFMPENQPINTLVHSLVARDPRNNAKIRNYQKVPGSDPRNFFNVNRLSGDMTLAKLVDFDTITPKTISCSVLATTPDGRTAKADVVVETTDLNDNSPVFLQKRYIFSVPENSLYPRAVGSVRAQDKDSGTMGQIEYELKGNGAQDFVILNNGNDGKDGDILVSVNAFGVRALDREKTPRYNFDVFAYDKGYPTRNLGIASVVINLIDENDNSPKFERLSYSIFTLVTTPPGTLLGTLKATDPDEGANGELYFAITAGNELGLFMIDTYGAKIKTKTSLLGHDRGKPRQLTVTAYDRGNPPRQTNVFVFITIYGPNAFIGRPQFIIPTPNMVQFIDEQRPIGTPVIQCKATDSNGPDNLIRFSFLETQNPDHAKFKIDPVTGKITTAAVLDRETQAQYSLQIQAIDGTKNSSNIMLVVALRDIDDHAPSFTNCGRDVKDPLTASIAENLKPPKFVIRVVACDKDAAPNNLLFYQITCGNQLDHFSIGLKSGEIHTKVGLDREAIPKYSLCVTVFSADPTIPRSKRNNNATVKSSTIGVIIEVLDVDDNGPSYSHVKDRTLTTGLLISAAYNSLVIDARARDRDTLPNSVNYYRLLSMKFTSGKSERSSPGAFSLNELSGEIRTSIASYSDYTNGFFDLRIEAFDRLGRRERVKVLIYVLNQSQRLKFIFAKPPSEVRKFNKFFMSDVSYVVGAVITTDKIRFSVGDAADFDFNRADVCFHMVKDNDIVQYADAQTLLSPANPALKKIYDTYSMVKIGLCNIGVKTYTRYTEASFWWVIIVLALFLFIFVLILIIVTICLWNRYRKFRLTNTSYIVKTGITTNTVSGGLAVSSKKINYEDIDVTLTKSSSNELLTTPMASGTTVRTEGYTNYGYDNRETFLGSSSQNFSAEASSGFAAGGATAVAVGGAVGGATTITGTSTVTGGASTATGGATTYSTGGQSYSSTNIQSVSSSSKAKGMETSFIVNKAPEPVISENVQKTMTVVDSGSAAASGALLATNMTVAAGSTPNVLRKVTTTTTTVTEEYIPEPADEGKSGLVITDVTDDRKTGDRY